MATSPARLDSDEIYDIVSVISRALLKEGISNTRVDRARGTRSARVLGVTTPTSTCQYLLSHRDLVPRGARTAGPESPDAVPQQRRRRIRIHNISSTRYMRDKRRRGLVSLWEEPEADNSGVRIPAEIRWLGGAKVRARF